MDPASVNSFLDQFLAVADSGFGLIQGDVNYVLNALIVISITLAGAQWALAGEPPMALRCRPKSSVESDDAVLAQGAGVTAPGRPRELGFPRPRLLVSQGLDQAVFARAPGPHLDR